MGPEIPFAFDLAGIAAGFLGGDDATSAMSVVLFAKQQKWTRWYNTPGCFEIARQYGTLAKYGVSGPSREARSGFLAVLGNEPGPKYKALHSGTTLEKTGHIAHLFEKECDARTEATMKVPGRESTPAPVTVVTLGEPSPCHLDITLETPMGLTDFVPVIVSMCAILACLVAEDYGGAFVILSGVLANGLSSLLISHMTVALKHPKAAEGSPPGDGLLMAQKGVIVLQGKEDSVNGITRGRLELSFGSDAESSGPISYIKIDRSTLYFGTCSLLFTLQFLTQLGFVIRGTMFGQTMFLLSLAVAWLYNFQLASADKEKARSRLLMDQVVKNHRVFRFICGTRTSMAVLATLALQPGNDVEYVKKFLEEMIPNSTKVWSLWRDTVAGEITSMSKLKIAEPDWEKLDDQERHLLGTLLADSHSALDYFNATKREEPQHEARPQKVVENKVVHEDSKILVQALHDILSRLDARNEHGKVHDEKQFQRRFDSTGRERDARHA